MKNPSKDTGKIARSAGTVSFAVMCSRVLGLVREQAFAILFGAGFAFDAFVVAFRIPNLLRDLFGEGALSAAFVAVFTDYDTNKGEEATWKLASNVLAFFLVLLSCVTLLGMFFSEDIVRLMAEAEFEAVPGKVELTRLLTVIMFPFLVFVSLASVVMGILNTRGRFFIPALASSFFNLGSIVVGVTLALVLPRFGYPAIVGMAIGTLAGGFLQLFGQVPALKKAGFVLYRILDFKDPGLRRILKLMVPALIGLAPLHINVLVNTYFASSLQEGSLSWLNYAFRLFWLPVGMFGVALSIAAMPVISRHAALKDIASIRETYASSQVMTFCLTIPAAVGLIMLAEPVIRLIFEHGKFDAFATTNTAEALSFYAIGLFSYASVKLIVPIFYALDDTKYPVMGSFLAMASNIIIILYTINRFQHNALALSISGAMTLNFMFLGSMLYRKLDGFSLAYLVGGLFKVVVASTVMAGWLFIVKPKLDGFLQGNILQQLVAILACVTTGAGVYGIVLYFLRVQELTILVEKVFDRLRK